MFTEGDLVKLNIPKKHSNRKIMKLEMTMTKLFLLVAA